MGKLRMYFRELLTRLNCCGAMKVFYVDDRKFVKIRIIAQGGFSVVYLVQEVGSTRSKFALKHITCHSQEDAQRAKHEIELHRKLTHCPYILTVEASEVGVSSSNSTSTALVFDDTGVDGGFLRDVEQVYILLPYCARGSLQEELETRLTTRDFMPVARVLRIFNQICAAVDAMHKLSPSVAHRDIKVANVLLSQDDTALLMDLGSAAEARLTVSDRKHAQRLTDDYAELCTMTYRAPELFNVQAGMAIDERIDVWVRIPIKQSIINQSLGCLLYALMFFRSPFDMVYVKGDSVALAVAGASRQTVIVPPDSIYPTTMTDLVFELMQMKPEDRPFMDDLIERLDGIIKAINVKEQNIA